MKITYIVQSNDKNICQIEKSYSHAMGLLKKLGSEYHCIRMIGHYFGEGYHTHIYVVKNEKIKRISI